MHYLFILVGLLLLFFGGDFLVNSSVRLAKILGLSDVLIGVVMIGFGTSAPELFVSLQAALFNQPDIALGNVVGSNLANILLILGVTAMIFPVMCQDHAVKRGTLIGGLVSIILFAMTFFDFISRFVGLCFMFILVGYLMVSYHIEKNHNTSMVVASLDTSRIVKSHRQAGRVFWLIIVCIISISMLVIGATSLVKGASYLAHQFGISDAIIGLSVVAIGTSLPELATAISAALKKNTAIIMGGVLGSNLFNTLSILGLVSIIQPISMSSTIATFDIQVAMTVALLLMFIVVLFKQLSRTVGGFFLLFYGIYIIQMYSTIQTS